MLEHFGSSIRAGKARAALLQMTQGKMTVLESSMRLSHIWLKLIIMISRSIWGSSFLDFDQHC